MFQKKLNLQKISLQTSCMDQSKNNKGCIHNWGTQKECLTSKLH